LIHVNLAKVRGKLKKNKFLYMIHLKKGLYLIQIRPGQSNLSRSSYPFHPIHANNRRETLAPIIASTSASPSIQVSPLQHQQQQQSFHPIQSPLASSTTSLLSPSSSSSNNSSFILRKKINYLTKYNLSNLIRDFELNLREACKCDVNTSYFSFKTTTDLKKMNKKSPSKKGSDNNNKKTADDEKVDNVFLEDLKLLQDQAEIKDNRGSKLYRKFSYNQYDQSQTTHDNTMGSSFELLEDCDLDKDFCNLKQTKFSTLHSNLSRFENLIITMNVEYCGVTSGSSTIIGAGLNSTNPISVPTSMSSSMNMSNSSSSAVCYTRVPSFAGSNNESTNSIKESSLVTSTTSTNSSSATLLTSMTSSSSSSSAHSANTLITSNNNNIPINPTNLMMKSMSSNSGELDSSMSLSNSLALAHLQLKRTFCYAIVNSKAKMITFYCFTTESCNYDSIKLLLEQAADLINQRYHLINNTILYKFGGLIGDNLLYDLKQVKSVSLAACFQSNQNSRQSGGGNGGVDDTAMDETKVVSQCLTKTNNPIVQKLSKSPIIHRQLSYGKSNVKPINPSLINNLQFSNSDKNTPWDSSSKSNSITQQQILSNINMSSSQISLNCNSASNLNLIQMKQLAISSFNQKSYDSIANIINKQLEFCSLYMTSNAAGTQLVDSPLSAFTSNLKANATNNSNRSIYGNQQISNASTCCSSSFTTLYGVGLCYQLFEMQQIYRHPRKIYELALNLSSNHSPTNTASNFKQQPQTSFSSISKDSKSKNSIVSNTSNILTSSLSQVPFKNQLNINDFYKNHILPVLVPLHYCCTPILFYPNWIDTIVTENSLKGNGSNRSTQLNFSNKQITSNLSGKANNLQSTEYWYSKMRQSVIIEYAKYFESQGFVK
jgi:hypothetical protein